jgi:hypothetical protein
MSRLIAIATASSELFETLRLHLVGSGMPDLNEDLIEPCPLTNAEAARDWLDTRDKALLVIDATLPGGPQGPRDPYNRGEPVLVLQQAIADSGIDTPVLVITPRQRIYADIEAGCTPERRAIALSLENLFRHRQAILRPFLAMLLGKPDENGAIPDTFRVIEVEFGTKLSKCQLGLGDGILLKWDEHEQVEPLRRYAQIFADEEVYRGERWPLKARQSGESLFRTHVVYALGEGLFGHIERAAGGLTGLAFRYVISDPSLYLAPFEASVRPMEQQDGPFVLLHAPLARRLPPRGTIRRPQHPTGRIPIPARMLFIRSQMGEHPDGPTTGDMYDLPVADGASRTKPAQFTPLKNIDVELAKLRTLASLRPKQLRLCVADLSKDCEPGTAKDYLQHLLEQGQYDIVHYAGHAWSNLDDEASLILPGPSRGKASALRLSTITAAGGLAGTRLAYLSACRGISKGSVQNLVNLEIPHGIGFRYNVEDDQAALFAADFYDTLFNSGFVCTAFRAACAAARQRLNKEDDSSIWLSPILLAQSADWAMRA